MSFEEEKQRKGLFIAIDANIGAGKTNACHAIASAAMAAGYPTRVMEEPTHHPKFNHFLQRYYEDLQTGNNTGGGFAMQMFMLCQRYEQHRLAVEMAWGDQGVVVVQDRPIYGDTVFATEECYDRMHSRGREQEEGVPLDYLKELYDNYQKLLSEMRRRGVRVLKVDWSGFGPPVEIWKKIKSLVHQHDQWYEQLAFSLAKEPRVPITPGTNPSKDF